MIETPATVGYSVAPAALLLEDEESSPETLLLNKGTGRPEVVLEFRDAPGRGGVDTLRRGRCRCALVADVDWHCGVGRDGTIGIGVRNSRDDVGEGTTVVVCCDGRCTEGARLSVAKEGPAWIKADEREGIE